LCQDFQRFGKKLICFDLTFSMILSSVYALSKLVGILNSEVN
jgi:hypothetical protein